jgi:predicted acyltransferase
MNAIIAFVGSAVMARCIYSIFTVMYDGARIPVQAAIYRGAFLSWLEPRDASFAFALTVVLFWYGILYVLYRRNIFLRV